MDFTLSWRLSSEDSVRGWTRKTARRPAFLSFAIREIKLFWLLWEICVQSRNNDTKHQGLRQLRDRQTLASCAFRLVLFAELQWYANQRQWNSSTSASTELLCLYCHYYCHHWNCHACSLCDSEFPIIHLACAPASCLRHWLLHQVEQRILILHVEKVVLGKLSRIKSAILGSSEQGSIGHLPQRFDLYFQQKVWSITGGMSLAGCCLRDQ